jgi:hypothetical protein
VTEWSVSYPIEHPVSSVTPALLRSLPPTTWFIETGTNVGSGVQAALDAGIYKGILSIEADERRYAAVVRRFATERTVSLARGDSALRLAQIARWLSTPATIYLDAHAVGYNPLLEELDAIATSACKTHTILIDDVRMIGTPDWLHISADDIFGRLRRINPAYRYRYADTVNAPHDLLIAEVL